MRILRLTSILLSRDTLDERREPLVGEEFTCGISRCFSLKRVVDLKMEKEMKLEMEKRGKSWYCESDRIKLSKNIM